MGDTRGQLPDRRQLLGTQALPFLTLNLMDHFLNPLQNGGDLKFHTVKIASLGSQTQGGHFMVQMGMHVLEPDTQAGNGSTQSPGHSKAADQATHSTGNAEQDHLGSRSVGTPGTLLGGFAQGVAIDF